MMCVGGGSQNSHIDQREEVVPIVRFLEGESILVIWGQETTSILFLH